MVIPSASNRQDTSPFGLTYLSRFLLVLIILQGFVYFAHTTPAIFQLIQHTITNTVAYIYQVIAEPVIVDKNTLRHTPAGQYLIVNNECTGLMLVATVFSAIIACQHSWLAKLKMLTMAILLLQCENIFRITHLLYEIKKENNNFEFYHLYIWQALNFIAAIIVIISVERIFGDNKQ